MENKQIHFIKVKKILTSCENKEHLKTAVKLINQFNKQYRIGEYDPEYIELERILHFMKRKFGIRNYDKQDKLKEDLSTSGKEFKTQAGLSGVSDLQKLRFEGDEIKGGKADKMTPSKLAKKHNVKVNNIRDEIKVGKNIEREHTKSDDLSKEIAMDHIDEFPDYYTNPKYGVKTTEKGLEKYHEIDYDKVLDLMKDKGWGDGLYVHQDDFESSDYYNNEDNPKDYADAFDRYMYDLANGNIDFDLDESTSAGSSGSYVGPLGGKEIRRTFHKSNIPTANAGGMTKPIGKMYTFKKSQLKEYNVFTKNDIMNENIGPIATYDSPAGWGNNEFMGTKGKKGNAVQRKGNDFKKTYDYDTGSSTFVKIKDKCKKFPYCIQNADAIELSKKPFKEDMNNKLPNKENIKESWNKFVNLAKREGKESVIAAKILKKILINEETSEKEIKFLKEQSSEIAKMLGVVAMGVVSTALPIIVEKMLNKKGVSLFPKENSHDLIIDKEREKLVESICKKTGKSKKYVHSLIERYL